MILERKVAIVGQKNVGKTALARQFVEETFQDMYRPTIEQTFVKVIERRKAKFEITIFDTSGQSEGDVDVGLRNFVGANGVIIVFSVADRASFELVSVIHDVIHSRAGQVDAALVANKTDLADQRVVSREEGQQLAARLQCPYFEVSAKSHEEVSRMFFSILSLPSSSSSSPSAGKTEWCAIS